MKCVILAAGTSTRLHPLTSSTPKSLLTVGKYTILERTIRSAARCGLHEFVIVTGFQSKLVTDFVRDKFPALRVEYVQNKRFAETNNAYSLALAATAVHGSGMILMDSDIVFDERILSSLLSSPYENCLALRTKAGVEGEDVKVLVDSVGRVIRIGKEITDADPLGESLGIEKFSQESAAKLLKIVVRRTMQEGKVDEFYEAAFQELIDGGCPIYAVDVEELPCIEIDTVDDLRRARDEIAPRLDRTSDGSGAVHPPRKYEYSGSLKSETSDELINTFLLRPIAGIIVRVLYRTSVTPNQVTVAAIVAGVMAALLYGHGEPQTTAAAGLLITLKDLLDSADGQLARAKNLYSRRGRFIDSIGDFVVNLLVFSAITVALYRVDFSPITLLLGAAGLVGITLRVSYHVFYHVSYLHRRGEYQTNRLTEEIREEDRRGDPVAFRLQKIYLLIYSWQDRMMVRLDGWARSTAAQLSWDEKTAFEKLWYSDRLALTLSGFIGIGTELALLTVFSLLNELKTYLYLNLFLMNSLWLGALIYRKIILVPSLLKTLRASGK